MKPTNSLINYIETLQMQGQYWFDRIHAIKTLAITEIAFKMSAFRLAKAKRVLRIYKGFYIIIPTEYRKANALPPYWYIDDLMKYLGKKYYVGLLTAAAHYGATHQVSQQFHVIVNQHLTLGKESHNNLVFFTKKNVSSTPINLIKVTTGYIKMSTPEATALDLVQYYKSMGYWSLIGTVLSELSEKLDSKCIVETAKQGKYEIATLQRLGYLLDFLGYSKKTDYLYQWLEQQWSVKKRKTFILLTPEKAIPQNIKQEKKWQLILNDTIEVDEL